jgi:alpha-L-fucosidase 2
MNGFIDGNNRPFQVLISVKNDGGTISSKDEKLIVHNAGSVEVYLTIATDYKMEYPSYKGEEPDVTAIQ